MIKLLAHFFSGIFITFFFAGCAGLFVVSVSSENQMVQAYQKRAVVFEKNEEWQMALYCWKMADNLSTDGKKTAKKVSELTQVIKQKSEKHFNKGMSLYKNDDLKLARREFYLSIKSNPDNSKAVTYLKNILKGEKYKTSNIILKGSCIAADGKQGDGPKHNDKKLSSMHSVAVKKINIKQSKAKKPGIDVEKKLIKGREFLEAGEYDNAIDVLEEILKYFPLNKKAFDLANASYYQKGEMLYTKKKYLQSLDMFRKVEPEYKDVKQKISEQLKILKNIADQYYKKGIKHYVNENFKKAIIEWRKALEFYPDYEDAKRDISKTNQILEKLNRVK